MKAFYVGEDGRKCLANILCGNTNVKILEKLKLEFKYVGEFVDLKTLKKSSESYESCCFRCCA